jgi:glycosyltransferase involved in cell wall biosynthesis
MAPHLSIIIPTRDRPALLLRAVGSALAQTGAAELEVVVVDDGSQPPVELAAHPRLRLLRVEPGAGGANARNVGTQAAEGHLVTYLDDDDELLAHHVSTALEARERAGGPAPVGVLTAIEVVGPGGDVLDVRIPFSSPRGRAFGLEPAPPGTSPFTKQTLVAERQVVLDAGGWDPRFGSRVHTELFFRLNQRCSLVGVPEVTYRLHRHPGERVSQDPRLRQESFALLLEVHGDLIRSHPAGHARLLLDHAQRSWRDGQRTASVTATGRALRASPLGVARLLARRGVDRFGGRRPAARPGAP